MDNVCAVALGCACESDCVCGVRVGDVCSAPFDCVALVALVAEF